MGQGEEASRGPRSGGVRLAPEREGGAGSTKGPEGRPGAVPRGPRCRGSGWQGPGRGGQTQTCAGRGPEKAAGATPQPHRAPWPTTRGAGPARWEGSRGWPETRRHTGGRRGGGAGAPGLTEWVGCLGEFAPPPGTLWGGALQQRPAGPHPVGQALQVRPASPPAPNTLKAALSPPWGTRCPGTYTVSSGGHLGAGGCCPPSNLSLQDRGLGRGGAHLTHSSSPPTQR